MTLNVETFMHQTPEDLSRCNKGDWEDGGKGDSGLGSPKAY